MKEWFATLIDDLKFLGSEVKREFGSLETIPDTEVKNSCTGLYSIRFEMPRYKYKVLSTLNCACAKMQDTSLHFFCHAMIQIYIMVMYA